MLSPVACVQAHGQKDRGSRTLLGLLIHSLAGELMSVNGHLIVATPCVFPPDPLILWQL